MSSPVSLKVFYAKSRILSSKNRTFKEVMVLIWQSDEFKEYEPLKIVFESTGKTLYADKAFFMSFLDGNITLPELIELTQCDDLYRNTNDINTNDGFTVDQGSLWKAHDKELTLIDDDYQVTAKMNKLLFEIVE